MPDLSESITVSAPASAVYDLVSDLPRMGEWSPECTRVTWSSRTPGPAVGARFVGHNRVGAVRWFTFGRVVDAVPGQRFSFSIHFGPIPVSDWSYDFTGAFAGAEAGCEVTESWTDRRPAVFRLLFRPFFGDRTARNVEGIHTTLQRLKSAAEAAGGAG
ncbi:SRPBCC family protein [Kribbella sp. NPDC049174]|uniref:SRPBCC family protein n=1 Tax=Kribbella sp. NPDC049174 TaxID=3364112 RepID=UPI0037201229